MYLSTILPYYKKKKYIKETLNSITNQTFKKHELIIIYDQTDKCKRKHGLFQKNKVQL